jgi:zinc/manganese transport system permease protein
MIDFASIILATGLAPFSPNLVHDVQVMLQFDFMRHAFLAGTAVALVSGLIGYFVILRRLIFTGDVLSHVAFPGALGAIVLGINPLLGVFGLAVVVALGMGLLAGRTHARDVTTGTVQTWILGIGVLLLSLYTSGHSAGNSSAGVNVLFGSLFGIHAREALVSAVVAVIVILILLSIARPLLFASLDPALAAARGVPLRLLELLFLALLAVTVAEAVQAVGALLLVALLVTPAAIARRLVVRPFAALLCSAGFALAFTWIGITLAFYLPYPVSFCITSLIFASYVAVVVGQRLWHRNVVHNRPSPVPA